MKILITGANGFVGRNLTVELRNRGYSQLYLYDIDSCPGLLDAYARDCEFVFHLAGVNRPEKTEDFLTGNFGFTSALLEKLKQNGNKAPVLITSSIQALLDNPYGVSKKAGEDLMRQYGMENDVKTYIYRLPNVFGKWCSPNYNSAVATFCHNIAHNLPIQVNDPLVQMTLVYIDDVVYEFCYAMEDKPYIQDGFCTVRDQYKMLLGDIVQVIESFRDSRGNLLVPDMGDPFTKKLYATYLSYLPEDKFSYLLTKHADHRGSFTEFLRSPDRGQVSVNISNPGITKGNHWHHTKNEKFLVVSGRGVIRLRRIDSDKITEYHVSGNIPEVVDIPVGYTHNIENLGDIPMVTIMWACEPFDKDNPDTYFLEV
ncbi:MAG: capsular polysaccharide biosynthesis protein CapF [Syntrophomonas sp.]